MDAVSVGNTISSLRKKMGITQTELAAKLNVSHKTISKWENGQGFPKVTQFPVLAEFFKVSVDFLILKFAIKRLSL